MSNGTVEVDSKWQWERAFKARNNARKTLEDFANKLLRDANRDAPKDTGTLRGSGFVQMDQGRAIVAYGAWYAAIVHERLDVRHTVGRAKWLELAAMQAQREMVATLARTLQKELGR